MLFNSLEYAFFLPVVFLIYWVLINRSLKLQNLFIILASYIFYGFWDARFLILIAISSLTDYIIGQLIYKANSKKKALLILSITINLGILGVFKYFNFFIDSFCSLLDIFDITTNPKSLEIILPVGISFYTFQTMSYTLDIYRGKIIPTKNILAFFAFVSFFPQLVAGPIERASKLLPQFCNKRTFNFNKARDGMRQILLGLFKKIIIADNCAIWVNKIFEDPLSYDSGTLFLGAFLFAFQIYGDFSGYSHIAIGSARLFGFELMSNFNRPYFSRNVGEFWRKWHISLSSWFRDYLYIPMGGSHTTKIKRIFNIIITFTVSGLWHGANSTYIIWGFLNGLYYIPLQLLNKHKSQKNKIEKTCLIPSIQEFFQITSTFTLITFSWIFFRSDSVSSALVYIKKLFQISRVIDPFIQIFNFVYWNIDLVFLIIISAFIIIEWVQRDKAHTMELSNMNIIMRWLIYFIVLYIILLYPGEKSEFIYFAF